MEHAGYLAHRYFGTSSTSGTITSGIPDSHNISSIRKLIS